MSPFSRRPLADGIHPRRTAANLDCSRDDAAASAISSTRRRVRAATALGAAVTAGLVGAAAASAETVTYPVPKTLVVSALNDALSGARMRLDSFGEMRADDRHLTWHVDNSRFSLPPAIVSQPIPVPEIRVKTAPTRKLAFYVDDFNLESIKATAHGSLIRLTARFESAGDEIKVKCMAWRPHPKNDFRKECFVDSLLLGKAANINNAVLTADFKVVAHKGSISYRLATSKLSADVKLQGLAGTLAKAMDLKNIVLDRVPRLATYLNRASAQDFVGAQVRKALTVKGLLEPSWKVTAVTDSGSSFKITVQRPDQIDGNTAKITKFAPLTAHVSHTCPTQVGFRATIKSKYALKGHAWLVNENGSTTPKLKWTIGKGQTASSVISRAFSGAAGTTYPGRSSRLVVRWKDQSGTPYTATSKPATYAVTCSSATGKLQG